MRISALLPFLVCPALSYADAVKVPVSDQGWNISLDAPPFARSQGRQDGPDFIYQANSGTFNLSIFVESQAKPGGSKECYEFYWPLASRNPAISQSTVKVSHTEKFYRVEYHVLVTTPKEIITQQNVNYYFKFKGKWVDVHISIISPTEADAGVITAFDKGLSYGE